ncbi:MAG: metal ABC transporter ATP-binding protein [Acidimicrobiia bacterium]
MTGPAVRARDLVLGYGERRALDRSSFEVPRAKVTAIIGPNGSGKSTLLSAIAGLIEPLAGELEVLSGVGEPRRISYVLQTTKVNEALPVTVAEVVTMGRYSSAGLYRRLGPADRRAVLEAMERTGVVDLARRHLQELSGGQRQRVFVAQGLAQDHDLLLLDEPLTAMDITAAQAVDEVIHDEIGRGCTVVVTTHDLSEAQIADHVLLLAGRVVASGPPESVLTAANLAAAYGPALLHWEEGRLLIDDAAHRPTEPRHVHRDRSIHPESSPTDLHGDHRA